VKTAPAEPETAQTDFDRRLERRCGELKWLYCELYHGDEAAFGYFLAMLRRCWEERKAPLREQDRRREEQPGWYRRRDILGMMLYVNAFAGNLKGVEEKLPYLQECGVNYLHLMPLLESPKGRSDGGYAVSDFRSVQPELGTIEIGEDGIRVTAGSGYGSGTLRVEVTAEDRDDASFDIPLTVVKGRLPLSLSAGGEALSSVELENGSTFIINISTGAGAEVEAKLSGTAAGRGPPPPIWPPPGPGPCRPACPTAPTAAAA